ncbi:MAG: hypothetical protein ACYCX2_04835 [Christensenellales bacterium]
MNENWFKRALPHMCIIIAVMLLTFLVADYYNTAMSFINHYMTKSLLLLFCILVIIMAVILIARQRRDAKKGR